MRNHTATPEHAAGLAQFSMHTNVNENQDTMWVDHWPVGGNLGEMYS